MKIFLTKKNTDEIKSNSIVATFFSNERPLSGDTALIDWRMNGYISKQIQNNKLKGILGESTLIPMPRKISSNKLLLFGMGDSHTISSGNIEEISQIVVSKIQKMKEKSISFIFSKYLLGRDKYYDYLKTYMFNRISKSDLEDIYFHYEKNDEKEIIKNMPFKNLSVIE